jgi:hypothetical protein
MNRVMVMQKDEGRDLPPLRAEGTADKNHASTTHHGVVEQAYKRTPLGSWAVIIILLIVAGTLAVFLIG